MEEPLQNIPDWLFEKYDIPAPRYTSYPTVPYWEEAPKQEDWFKNRADEIREGMLDNVESVLYRQAMEGNTTSLIFLLKTQAKDRGYTERQEIGITHIEQPLFPEIEYPD